MSGHGSTEAPPAFKELIWMAELYEEHAQT